MKTSRRTVVALTCLVAAALSASSQRRDAATAVTTGTAQISGAVLTSDAPAAPVRRATMTLTGDRSGVELVAVTDDSGQFAFADLPPDRYTVSAAKGGYLVTRYGSRRPGGSGTPVVVGEGQRIAIAMTLIKGSVLTGTVRDALGQPLPDVTVSALRLAASASTGVRGPQAAIMGSSAAFPSYFPDSFPGTATTDDRGVYRIFGLASGEYVVSATVRPARNSNPTASFDVHQVSRADVQRALQLLRGSAGSPSASPVARGDTAVEASRVDYAPVYHPSAVTAAEATVIPLGQSEERADVDVLLRLVPTARIVGTVTLPDGSPVMSAQVSLMDPDPFETGALRITRSGADGTFTMAGIHPGRYRVRSHLSSDGLIGETTVEVAGHDVSASILLTAASQISGRVVFDGVSKVPDAKTVTLMVAPWVLGGSRFTIAADGQFVISQVPPGKYRLRINGRPPAGWVLRSTMLAGADVSDIAFDVRQGEDIEGVVIALTDRPAEVSGRFLDATGQPAPEYVLVVLSADRRFWVPGSRRTQQVRPDVNGTFVARDLPAGDYLISAVTDLEDGQWNDPAFLAALAANAIRITLAEGERKVQDIRVGGR